MERKVDLHIHSYASDGEWSPEQIITHIDMNDIKIFAVCDHDEIGAVEQLSELTKNRKDLTYIKAFEFSSKLNGQEHHILTYHIDIHNEELLSILHENRRLRDEYNDGLVKFLSKEYNQLSFEDYQAYNYDPYQGGWRTLSYLVDRGVASDLMDYFAVTSAYKQELKFPEPSDIIPKLNKLGCITVLAHPPAYCKGDLYSYERLDYFRGIGIQGVECHCQYLKELENAHYYVDYCNKHHLYITGGSDCHGSFAGRRLGYPSVTESMITLPLKPN